MGSCSALSCSIGAKPWLEDAGSRFGEVDHAATPRRVTRTRRPRAGRGVAEEDSSMRHPVACRVSPADQRRLSGGACAAPGGPSKAYAGAGARPLRRLDFRGLSWVNAPIFIPCIFREPRHWAAFCGIWLHSRSAEGKGVCAAQMLFRLVVMGAPSRRPPGAPQ